VYFGKQAMQRVGTTERDVTLEGRKIFIWSNFRMCALYKI
jgi:hypothetical protein